MKEKIFKNFTDSLNKMNKSDGLSDYHFSKIYDLAEKLADKEYQQGRADVIDEFVSRIEKDSHYEHPIDVIEVDRCRAIAEQLKEKKE